MMFTYKCFPKATVQLFKKAQEQLEEKLDIRASREVLDVDGSRILCYKFHGSDLFVVLDVDVDSIVIESELEIPGLFCQDVPNKKYRKSGESPCVKTKGITPAVAKSGKTPKKVYQLAK